MKLRAFICCLLFTTLQIIPNQPSCGHSGAAPPLPRKSQELTEGAQNDQKKDYMPPKKTAPKRPKKGTGTSKKQPKTVRNGQNGGQKLTLSKKVQKATRMCQNWSKRPKNGLNAQNCLKTAQNDQTWAKKHPKVSQNGRG